MSLGWWAYSCSKLGNELTQLQSQMESVRAHPLYDTKVPKNLPWSRLIVLLLNYADADTVEVSEDGVRVCTDQQRAARRILRALGFVLVGRQATDLLAATQESISATYVERNDD